MPWNVRFRGGQLPLAAVLGALGTFAAWVSVVVLHTEARTVGHRLDGGRHGRLLRLPPPRRAGSRGPVPDRAPAAPAGFKELAYGSALVPMFGTDVSAQALRRAARLAGDGATVDAVYVIPVPNQLSLDSGLEEEEELGRSVLDSRADSRPRAQAQDPHEPDPNPQPRRGAGGRGAGAKVGGDLPRHRPRAAYRARARAHRAVSAGGAALPSRDRDRRRALERQLQASARSTQSSPRGGDVMSRALLSLRAALDRRSLDSTLAAGVDPEAEPALSLRAGQLARPATRRALAGTLEELVDAAGAPHLGPQPPLRRGAVLAARPTLRSLAELLRSGDPMPTRALALAAQPWRGTRPVPSTRPTAVTA